MRLGDRWVAVVALVVVAACLSTPALAGLTDFTLSMGPQTLFYERFAIYAMKDAPFGAIRDPYGIYNLHYRAATADLSLVSAELLIIHTTLWNDIGYTDELTGESNWCCSPGWYAMGICSRINRLILPPQYFNTSDSSTFYYYKEPKWTLATNGTSTFASADVIDWRVDFVRGGVWYMLGVNCAGTTASGESTPDLPPVAVTGQSTWMNSIGYLPGQIFGNLAVYWVMTIFYFVIGVVWLTLCLVYRKDLMGLQRAIGLVIIFSLAENLLWAIDYYTYNQNGVNSNVNNIIGALLTASKTALSRLLLLLVGIGYSITSDTLPKRTVIFVALVTVIYFFAVAAYQYMLVVISAGEQVSDGMQLLVMAIFVLGTAIIFAWIFIALARTYRMLGLQKQTIKLAMYKKLLIVLVIAFAISAILFLMQAFIEWADQEDDFWVIWWLWDAYFEFAFLAILITIAIIWRPSGDNRRYAYTQVPEGPSEGGDEELADISLSLPSPAETEKPKTKRKARTPAPQADPESDPELPDVVDELDQRSGESESETVRANPFSTSSVPHGHPIASPPNDGDHRGSDSDDAASDEEYQVKER